MKRKTKDIIMALLTSIVLTLDYKNIYLDMLKITNPFKINYLVVVLLALLLYSFYNKRKSNKLTITKYILITLFSLFLVFGNSYMLINSWNIVFGSYIMFTISIIAFISYYYLLYNLFILLDSFLIKEKKLKIKNQTINKYLKLLEEKPFLTTLITILIFWSVYIIAFYPTIMAKDPSFQILQFFNIPNKYDTYVNLLNSNVHLTNHHPIIHTLLLGGCIKLGRFFGSDNFGLFIYSMIQVLALSTTCAYSIKLLKTSKVNKYLLFILVLIYSLVPMFPLYAMTPVKDTLYTTFIMLYIMWIINYLKNYKSKKLPLKEIIYIVILMLLIALFRNNGFYVVVLSFIFVIFFSRKNMLITSLILVLFSSTYLFYNNYLLSHYNITQGSIREVLSIPFQQTARLLKEDDISDKDRNIINKVLPVKVIKKKYDPTKADFVKNNYNKNATKLDLNNYFKVWFKYLLKKPNVYIEATINNTYGYFYPNDIKWYVYTNHFFKVIDTNGIVNYHYNKLSILRSILSSYGIAFIFIPVLGLISNIGINTWLLLIISAYLIDKKEKKYLIALIPLYLSLLVCVASPVDSYFRYAMPYIFIMPFLIIYFYNLLFKRKDSKN